MKWPGKVKPGTEIATPVSTLDLMPTLTAMAGITLPKLAGSDGVSLVDLLQTGTALPRDTFYWHNPAPRPASTGDHLRFSAMGLIELSFDGGKTWAAAPRQPQERDVPEHFSSYWIPLPAGVDSVRVRGKADRYLEHWIAKDFSIWSRAGS